MIAGSDSNLVLNALECSTLYSRELRAETVKLLSGLPKYDWCGVYRLEGAMLELDEFVGEPTEHKNIPVGRGVCGAAVARNSNQVVEDVTKLENYLACSLTTRSEIVVLIRKEGLILGQLDIDSHSHSAFDSSDERFLEKVAQILADRW